MRIGANIPSLQAYNNMTKAYKGIALSNLRSSSGVRINSAADDAAGLAIATKIRQQVKGIAKASQNSSNATSLIQTADGALTEVHNMLQRIRELAVQAANDTNEPEDRRKMQDEIDSLIQEINDTPLKIEYNKIKMLNGECDRIMRTDPPTGLDILRISDTTPYGDLVFQVTAPGTKATLPVGAPTIPLPSALLDEQSFSINGYRIDLSAGDDAASIRAKILLAAEATGLAIVQPAPPLTIVGGLESKDVGSDQKIQISGDPALLTALGLGNAPLDGTNPTINVVTAGPGAYTDIFTADYTCTAKGNRITFIDRNNVEICLDLKEPIVAGANYTLTTKHGPLVIQVGANKDMGMYMTIPKINAKTIEIDRADVTTREKATATIDIADKAIAIVSAVRSRLGAYQNRLDYTVTGLDNSYINASDSLSRIEDTDMAYEMTEYAKFNVMYQAGIALLAQSNARPQQILQLLQ